jgi:S-adenosylmethionine hydrolase
MSLITLTTDFGTSDGYVGTMKGVILGIAPNATIVDITHEIQPHAISQAAFVIATAAPYFPVGTVHVVIVDPGVGSQRRAIVVQTERAIFVAPDNGVLTFTLRPFTPHRRPIRIAHLTRRQYWLPQTSNTFHGRDIFAPVAAYLAKGVPLSEMGEPIHDPVLLEHPQPQQMPDGSLQGRVIYADRFGNLVTDIPAAWLGGTAQWYIEAAGCVIEGLRSAYADVPRGGLLALIGSAGTLELAVREGSAASTLKAGEGSPVTVRLTDARR